MSKTPRGTVISRLATILVFLEEPHTAKELAQKLGIKPDCAYVYLDVLKKAGYPLESREKYVSGTGLNPQEYWINCCGQVVLETVRMIAQLRGM